MERRDKLNNISTKSVAYCRQFNLGVAFWLNR